MKNMPCIQYSTQAMTYIPTNTAKILWLQLTWTIRPLPFKTAISIYCCITKWNHNKAEKGENCLVQMDSFHSYCRDLNVSLHGEGDMLADVFITKVTPQLMLLLLSAIALFCMAICPGWLAQFSNYKSAPMSWQMEMRMFKTK